MALPQNLGRLSAGLTADASLNIGVGVTPSGTYKFEVAGAGSFSTSATAQSLIASNTFNGDPQLGLFTNASTGTSAEAVIYVKNGATTNDATFIETTGTNFTSTFGFVQDCGILGTGTGLLGGMSIMVRANADMRFYTNGHNNERMRITSGGLLQFSTIGTIPTDNNSIYSYSSNGYFYIQGGTTGLALAGSGNRNNAIYLNSTDNAIYFHTNNAEKMRITSGGNVGIGTTSPNGKFNVSNGGAEGIEFWVLSATATNLIQSYNRSTSVWNSLEYKALDHIFYGSGAERMRITSGGNVLIGTTTDAGFKLDVSGSSRVSGASVSGSFNTTSGTAACPYASYATFYTAASGQNAIYLVTLQLSGYTTYTAYATICQNDTVLVMMNQVNNNAGIQVSGLNIQGTNGSGITQSMVYKIIKIS